MSELYPTARDRFLATRPVATLGCDITHRRTAQHVQGSCPPICSVLSVSGPLGTELGARSDVFPTTIGGEHLLPAASVTSSVPNVSGRMVEVSPDAATYDVRSFQSFYGRLHTEEEIANNPAAKLRHPKIGEPPASVAIATIRSWPQ